MSNTEIIQNTHFSTEGENESVDPVGRIIGEIQSNFNVALNEDYVSSIINQSHAIVSSYNRHSSSEKTVLNIALRKIGGALLEQNYQLTPRLINNHTSAEHEIMNSSSYSEKDKTLFMRKRMMFPLRRLSVLEETYVSYCILNNSIPDKLLSEMSYSAQEILTIANLPLVLKLAHEYSDYDSDLCDDLYQIGSMKMYIRAVKYDYHKLGSFGNYMNRYLRRIMERKRLSINQQGTVEYSEIIENSVQRKDNEAHEILPFKIWVEQNVRNRNPRRAKILELYFGLNSDQGVMTCQDIANVFGVKHQGISAIVRKELNRYRNDSSIAS